MKLDHVIIAVARLERAAARYEQILGRPVAVWSEHPRGTCNALFVFDQGPYLELLAPWDAPEQGGSATALRRFLDERGDGLFGYALAPDDIGAALTRMRGLGGQVTEPIGNSGLNRDGRRREWRGAAIPTVADETAFFVEHLGWDWRGELLAPPLPERATTAVTGIHHIAFDLADAGAASHDWEERYGLGQSDAIISERMGARVNIHQAGEATVEFVAATRRDGPVAQRIAARGPGLRGLAFRVDDLDGAVAALHRAGIELSDPEPGVLPNSRVARLDPASAHGVAAQLVEFDR